jgi:uncharacterized protein (TIGR02646 family)
MIKIRNGRLPRDARMRLQEYQAVVDNAGDYADRVDRAKSEFSARNRRTNPAFRAVRSKLDEMCSGARRCMYCEDSVADEVEHHHPKDLYPELVFVWRNFLYACGPCNGPKRSDFAVIDPGTSQLIPIGRGRDDPIVPPASGDAALIDPRREDPLAFLVLDLRDTFEFAPMPELSSADEAKAKYTMELLRLNKRDYLIAARSNAYSGYLARLEQYATRKDDGATRRQLAKLKRGIQGASHPTVWAEMKRQATLIAELDELFSEAPEALDF